MYPNNKSYIKECIVQRKVAFKNGDLLNMKNTQKELNHKLRTARRKEREKFESHCFGMNTEKLWNSLKTMTNMTPAQRCINVLNEEENGK